MDFDQQMKYYQLLPENKQEAMKGEIQGTQQLQQMLNMLEAQYKGSTLSLGQEQPSIITNLSDTGKKKKDSNK